MSGKRRWIWVFLFICLAVLLGTLATSWNVVLVHDSQRMLELAKEQLALSNDSQLRWTSHILGTLGFVAVLGIIFLFFYRLLGEMRLNQLQSEFLATVSHELKTPIAAMELTSGLIRSGDLSASEVEKLWVSHDAELKRLRQEVEALLEAARWQHKQPSQSQTEIFLEDWLQKSLDRWKRILGPGSDLIRQGEPLPTRLKLDLRMLELITDNLIDNARKFSIGQPSVVIKTRLAPAPLSFFRSRRPKVWQIEIQDSGRGFAPSDSKKIFGRFFRSQSTDSPYAIPGTGLGLYIAQSASTAIGLRLSGSSDGKGKGARFILEGQEMRT